MVWGFEERVEMCHFIQMCWTWAGSPTWARLNPTQKPKEVETVVLETTALNCHVH